MAASDVAQPHATCSHAQPGRISNGREGGKKLHDAIGFVGLRAHATAVGLIQLTLELVAAGVLDDAALERIKSSIAQDLALGKPPHAPKAAFEAETKQRLDRLFAGEQKLEPHEPPSA